MISSRNDWNRIAGMDNFLKQCTGGGDGFRINNTSYSCAGIHAAAFGTQVCSFSAQSFGGFVYSGDTMCSRQHWRKLMLSFLRARKCSRRALRGLARESMTSL